MSPPSASSRSTPVSASWPSRSSCRLADRPIDDAGPNGFAHPPAAPAGRLHRRLAWPSSGGWRTGRSSSGDDLAAKAVAQTTIRIEEPTRRGDDLRPERHRRPRHDRRARPARRRHRQADRPSSGAQTGDELVRILGLDAGRRGRAARQARERQAYVILAREIEPAIADADPGRALPSGRIVGITLEPEPMRVYPQAGGGPDSTLAAHLLGLRQPRRARASTASSRPTRTRSPARRGSSVAERDANGRPLLGPGRSRRGPGVPGQDLRLTIDAGLQLAVEQELLAAWVADKAKSVSAVVMDPYTGEIYAEATVPVLRRERLPRRSPPRRRSGSSTRSSRTSTSRGPSSR